MQTFNDMPKTMKNTNNMMDFRPKILDQVVGQTNLKEYLKVRIKAFKKSGVSLSHTLFLGYSGLGKTTLANVVANEMGVNFHQVMATRIKNGDDLYNILKIVEENDVVFIDEIHALSPKVQEQLYGVMEDFTLTLQDKNLNRLRTINLPRFTLIGATTHTGDLQPPLLSRFKSKSHLLPYSIDELTYMITTAAERIYNIEMPNTVARGLAKLSRKTARIAYNLLESLMVVAEAQTTGKVTPDMLNMSLVIKMLRYEQLDPIIGLDVASRHYLVKLIGSKGPLGIDSICNLTKEQPNTITGMIEPFLLSDIEIEYNDAGKVQTQKSPFVRITKSGRVATQPAIQYINTCQSLQKSGWFANESLNIKSE